MAELAPDQLDFLANHRIPLSCVFDASGMTRSDYRATMKELGKSFAYGVTPCNKARHTLRSRGGHCIQCDHAQIAYMLRHEATAFIYIAASAVGRFIKVGVSNDVPSRRENLNNYRYGGQADWQILAIADCSEAGRVECAVHAQLSQFRVPGEYTQGGIRRRCYELFQCDFADARDAIRTELPRDVHLKISDETRAVSAFAFR